VIRHEGGRKMKKKDEKNEEAENGYLLGAAGEIST
jgi:hypothetical protein